MKKLCFILLFSMMTLAGMQCAAQVTFLRGRADADTIAVGQPFDYQLSLTIPKDYYVEWGQFGDTLSKSIDVLNVGDITTTPISNSDNVIMSQHLTLTSFDTGYVYVPEIGVTYSKSLQDSLRFTLYTNEAELYVTTVAVDTTQAFRPIKTVIRQNVTAKEVFPWVVVALVIAGIVYLIIRRKKHPKVKEKVVEEKKKPVIPAIVTARAKLAEMRDNESWNSSKTKDYYTDLTDIAREYLEGQFEIDAVEMTTDDILEEVKELDFEPRLYGKLKETMELSDLVKFAKYTTSPLENDNAMSDMTDFVNDSYAHYEAMKAKEEEEARQHV